MATKQLVTFIDDTDGSEAIGTVEFALDREQYEIDLSAENTDNLRGILDRYIKAGRKLPAIKGRPSRTKSHQAQAGEIREWAKRLGIAINERGRVPAEIIAQWQASRRAVPVLTEPATEPGEPGPVVVPPEPASPEAAPQNPGPEPPASDGNRNSAIRAWAKLQGIKVNGRGKIPVNVAAEYDARHKGDTK